MFTAKLHPYQEEDVAYILERKKMMLAYGTGTGKTVMTIAALERGMDEGLINEPGLIICLSPLKDQWAQAIHRWTGGEKQELDPKTGLLRYVGGSSTPLVISGTAEQRKKLYQQAIRWHEHDMDYIMLSYEQVVQDWAYVRKLPRGFVVLDESSYIKGFSSKRSRRVKRLSDAPIKVALTGTPIGNGKPEEIYSQMQFVDDTVLGPWSEFDPTFIVRNSYGQVLRYRNIPRFLEKMEPVFRRRTRHDPDVAPFFPEVRDEKPPIVVHLDPATTKLYKLIDVALVKDLQKVVHGSGFDLASFYGGQSMVADGTMGRIAQKRMALQMLVDHPDLLRQSAEKYLGSTKGGSEYIAGLVADGHVPDNLKTPKMDAALAYINAVLEADPANKIVVFATYVDTLRLFQERLTVESVTFHGGMTERQKAIAMGTFKQKPECRVFLSSDAGGYGIDLPEANHLLNYSLPETWGTSHQRETRIIRAGSGWDEVHLARITVAGSIDVMKYNRIVAKGKVSAAFLEGKGLDAKGGLTNDAAGLLKFLTEEAGELCVKVQREGGALPR